MNYRNLTDRELISWVASLALPDCATEVLNRFEKLVDKVEIVERETETRLDDLPDRLKQLGDTIDERDESIKELEKEVEDLSAEVESLERELEDVALADEHH